MLFESELDYQLIISQNAENGRVALGKEKDRKPLDPPPVVELRVSRKKDPQGVYLQSPYYFMSCSIIKDGPDDEEPKSNALMGSLVSSLHRLKTLKNGDGAFFIFGDLSVRYEGKFRLLFNLYQMSAGECIFLNSVTSGTFTVYPAKSFPGLKESTFLTRSFSDQGVRLRLRKDSRSISNRKRTASVADFAPNMHGEATRARSEQSQHSQLTMRSNGVEDGSSHYGSQSPSLYGPQPGMLHSGPLKRKRPEDDAGANGLDLSGYPQRHGFQPALHSLHIPHMTNTTTGYSMQSPASAPPGVYGSPLARIDTSNHGRPVGPSSTPNSAHVFQSPHHLRQSPQSTYHPYHAMQSPVAYSSAAQPVTIQSMSPHLSNFNNQAPLYSPHPRAENSPRTHPTLHAVNHNASSSNSPSETHYTPAPPQEPYNSSVTGSYTYPQNMGVGGLPSLADPRNAPTVDLSFHDSVRSTNPYDDADDVNNTYRSNGAASTAYGSSMPGATSSYTSNPSTAASAYQDGDRTANSYQDHDKGNNPQQ